MRTLPGEPPDAVNVPPGCRFHPRCPIAEERCRVEVPQLLPAAAGGTTLVACHLRSAEPGPLPSRRETVIMDRDERRRRGPAGGAAAGPCRRWGARVRRPLRVAGGRQPGVAGLAVGAQRRRGAPSARRRGLRCSETDAERPPGRDLRERPHGCGDRWLRLAHGDGGERLESAADPAGPWRAVLAVDAFSEPGRPASLDWFFPSPDGRYAAFGVSWGGDEQCVLRLLDLEREELLPVAVPECVEHPGGLASRFERLLLPRGSLRDEPATRPAVPGGRR